jgi:adenine-specific DNA-methyltransferase
MEAAGVGLSEGWFQMMRLIKKVGGHIIEFLAQIEEFQKMLWEKRKFITETFYCITVGCIPEEFYPEIAACDVQWEEWKALFSIEEGKNGKSNRRMEFLKAHPTLVVDTRRFSPDPSKGSGQCFTDRLLASFDDLDEATEGLLVHGENWQALNLLAEKYREQVKCIYIDPPYNTGKDGFLYKDQFQHSSWLSMLVPRVAASFHLLSGDGVFFTSLDRNEFSNLQAAVRQSLPAIIQMGEIVWHNARDNNPTQIALEHEYILCLGKTSLTLTTPWKSLFSEVKETLMQEYEALKAQGFPLNRIQRELRAFIKANREILGEIDRYKHVDEFGVYTGSESVHNPHPGGYDYDIIHPVTGKPMRKPANGYRFPEITMRQKFIEKGRLLYGTDENRIVKIKLYLEDYQDSLRSVIALDGRLGAYSIRDLFAEDESFFPNPKPVQLIQRLLGFIEAESATIIDFFAGSGVTGHALIGMNRLSKHGLRFILVEMAQYFDTVLLPRIKKVTFSPEWKDGKPKRMATAEEAERSPRIVKVIRLESYEDALNNIAFDEPSSQQAMQFEDYLLQYLLQWETRKSETLLNVAQLAKPFSYQLHIHRDGETRAQAVDLPETFAYLLGLYVRKRQALNDNERRYLVYCGTTREGRKAAVIWRETEGWKEKDYKRDKEFVAAQKLTEGMDEVYVNGDSYIPGARVLEKLFKERMFAPVEV